MYPTPSCAPPPLPSFANGKQHNHKMKMMQQTGSNCAIAGSSVCNAIANANASANGNGHAGSPEINGNCTGTAETFLTAEDRRYVALPPYLL